MKHTFKKHAASITLSLMMLANASPFALRNANAAEPAETYATRGEVVHKLLTAADDYTLGLQKGDIIQGYGDGDLKEGQNITRAEAFTMTSRAFGKLPEPKGNTARIAPKDVNFSEVPEWAQASSITWPAAFWSGRKTEIWRRTNPSRQSRWTF